ncbi:F-box/LRR-repeat protein At3g48880-like [Solanum tuberosum]|uniref:F-box/LRR-repeat protein At3g48880-like n=1 Tax=Solanum tuberosum TaxID=4113 RepID=UPI00073A45C2|nr:PREDICTED: F-box/LRR-repeat protein At3g48880-like [Solanum tuberosum]
MSFQKLEKIEVVVMEEGNPPVRRWEDLNIDMLVKIFQSFDLFQLISVIPQVFPAWQSTCSDQRRWKTLDLSIMQSNFIRVSISPQLTYIAKRCPRLKRLVMSAWEKLEKQTICSAFHEWKDVESLTMPSLEEPAYVIEKIGRSCKKLSELKIMTPCDILFASALVSFLPNLKVLSVRCTKLSKPALVILLDGLKKLKVLNISHCIITEDLPPPAPMKILTELDESILEKSV